VIANSEDWRDVFASVHFANLQGYGSDFLVSTRHGQLLLGGISKSSRVLVVSSVDQPFVFNYDNTLRNNDFASAEEIFVDDASVELVEELPNIRNFVVVGNTYGYSAIAVAPYAVVNEAWVLFADRTNIAEIENLLNSREVDEILIYGFVEREVRDSLEQFDPEIINTGDRFQDNVEIVKKYREIKPIKQVVLTNGDFVEKQVMNGLEPVLFTGKENVPDQIANYLKNSDIEVGVLVGSDLVGAATNIRRTTGISVIVKFARGARAPAGSISAVEGLDLFYIPTPTLIMDVHSVKYNRATSQLEITYKSESNVPIYFKGTIDLNSDTGDTQRFGDFESIFIAPNDFKTVSYPDLDIEGDKLTADLFVLFGETPDAFDRILEGTFDVEFVNIIDGCDIDIDSVKYSKPKDAFVVRVKNVAEVDCWVDIELRDIIIDNTRTTLGAEGAEQLSAGKTGKVIIEAELTDEDLEENSLVELFAFYGEREDNLVKTLQGTFELEIISISGVTIVLIIAGLIVLVLIILVLIRKYKKKDDFDF
jgi:hypothetical protein